MTFPISPGVYSREIDLTAGVTAGATTAGAIAGIFAWGPVLQPTLISSQSQLVSTFGRPTNLNAETWWSAANFLAYGNSLWVVRTANTSANATNTALLSPNSAYNALAYNATPPANSTILSNIILNSGAFSTQYNFSNAYYVAKFPGNLGNSLRVSQIDSPASYTSVVNLSGTILTGAAAGNSYNGTYTLNVGSNTATVVFTPTAGSNVAAAQTFGNVAINNLSVGDYVQVGAQNTGPQMINNLKITQIGNVSLNSTAAYATINFDRPSKKAFPVTGNAIVRFWEFYNFNGSAPGATPSVVKITSNTAVVDQMSVAIVDQLGYFTGVPGTLLEIYPNVSFALDAVYSDGSPAYYQTVINAQSPYVWAVNDRPGIISTYSNTITNSSNPSPYNEMFMGGQDGDSELVAPLGTLALGWQMFTNKTYPINLLVTGHPMGLNPATVNGKTYSNYQLANWIIQNVVDARGNDCMAFFSPDKATVVNNAGNEAVDIANWATLTNPSTYLFLDTGYKYQFDTYNNIYRWIPLNGDIAGLCVYTDSVANPWTSPAGINRGLIKNVVKLAYNPSETDRDYLYPLGINPVVTESGYGTYLDGDRTFTIQTTAFNRINVRRLFIYLEQAIKAASKTLVFEINDIFLQNQFKNMVNPFLKGVQGGRGITDFIVICDATNNTPQVVDSEQFVAGIYIKPARVADFIRIDFVAVNDGVSFSTVESASY